MSGTVSYAAVAGNGGRTAANATIAAQSAVAFKHRIAVTDLYNAPSYAERIIGGTGDGTTAGLRLYASVIRADDTQRFSFHLRVAGGFVDSYFTDILAADMPPTGFIRIYYGYDPAIGARMAIFTDAGVTLSSLAISYSAGPMAVTTALGRWLDGRGDFPPLASERDWFAVYNALLSGNAQWSTPAPSDANVVAIYDYEDAVGQVSAVNTLPGGEPLALTGATLTGPSGYTVTGVLVTPGVVNLGIASTAQLAALVSGTANPPQTVLWSVTNQAVATVSAAGLVTGVGVGNTVVRATSTADPTKYMDVPVTITAAAAGEPSQVTLAVEVLDQNGAVMPGHPFSISAPGSPVAVRAGNTIIAAPNTSGDTSVTVAAAGVPDVVVPVHVLPPIGLPPAPIAIALGASIQAAIDANPAGSTFQLAAGTYLNQTVLPKSGTVLKGAVDPFTGKAATTLDGTNVTVYAVHHGVSTPPYPSNVTLQFLRVTRYLGEAQMGAIRAGSHTSAEGTTGWVIEDCEVDNNANLGIRVGHNIQVRRCVVHHNGSINIGGISDNGVIEYNELHSANLNLAFSMGFEAGGTKFVKSSNLIMRGNTVHHNRGPGLWCDISCKNVLFTGNTVYDCDREGIVYEISYGATITNNKITACGMTDPLIDPGPGAAPYGQGTGRYTYGWNAGIGVHSSPNVEVANNVVKDCFGGIVGIQQDRDTNPADIDPVNGPHYLSNLYVHDNEVWFDRGLNGAMDDSGSLVIFGAGRNNRFVNNSYKKGAGGDWAWNGGLRTFAQFQALGQDATGSSVADPDEARIFRDLTDGTWVATGSAVATNNPAGVEGPGAAPKVRVTASTNSHNFRTLNPVTVVPGTNYEFTIYVEERVAGGKASYSVYNTTAGAELVPPTDYSAQLNAGSNFYWRRIVVPFTPPAGCTAVNVYGLRDSLLPQDANFALARVRVAVP